VSQGDFDGVIEAYRYALEAFLKFDDRSGDGGQKASSAV
jgi:hypothetical protein